MASGKTMDAGFCDGAGGSVLALEDRDRGCNIATVTEREMDGDPVWRDDVGGASGELDFGPAVRQAAHADLPPADRARATKHLQRLVYRLLGGEARSECGAGSPSEST